MDNLIYGIVAGVTVALLLVVLIPAAGRFRLVDIPGSRKQHKAPTPLVGGIAIYIAAVIAISLAPNGVFSISLLGWLGLVLLLGVLDDIFDISYAVRLTCHASIVVGIYLTDSLVVGEIGRVTGSDAVSLIGGISLLFTIIGVIGVVNAVNMSDGADGLVGALSIVSLLAILVISARQPDVTRAINTTGVSILVGATAAFLVFNSRLLGLKRAIVFLGDAGSTTIGFILAYLLIDYSQGSSSAISPVLAGWIIGLPLLDASGVILYRVVSGQSPFHPDRSHMHHLLMDAGFSVNKTVGVMIGIHVILISFSLTVFSLMGTASEFYLFWCFISLVVMRAGWAWLNIDFLKRRLIDRTIR